MGKIGEVWPDIDAIMLSDCKIDFSEAVTIGKREAVLNSSTRSLFEETYDKARIKLGIKNSTEFDKWLMQNKQLPDVKCSWYIERLMLQKPCPACGGKRLKPEFLAVSVDGMSIMDFCALTVVAALGRLERLRLTDREEQIAYRAVKEIRERLGFLRDVGLEYLSLERASASLSGGESQRIRLATQIGSKLMGVLYILDEPSIGLHQRDNHKLLATLTALRDLGNTLIIVEHDEETIRAADYIVDIGPGAGELGGFATLAALGRAAAFSAGESGSGRRPSAASWCGASTRRPLRAADRGPGRRPLGSRYAGTLRRRDSARLVRVQRPAASHGPGARARHAARPGGPGPGAIGSGRPDSTRPFHRAGGRGGGELEWCHRRLLSRIHRLTIGRLRREIEPVTTAGFYAFLRRWQHLAEGGQLHGADGTLQIVKQLQGCEFPAAAWETEVLPRRVARYQPEYLDQICLSGEVIWGRLSPHPAFEREEEDRHSRVRPSRVAPLAMFLREDAAWLLAGRTPCRRRRFRIRRAKRWRRCKRMGRAFSAT